MLQCSQFLYATFNRLSPYHPFTYLLPALPDFVYKFVKGVLFWVNICSCSSSFVLAFFRHSSIPRRSFAVASDDDEDSFVSFVALNFANIQLHFFHLPPAGLPWLVRSTSFQLYLTCVFCSLFFGAICTMYQYHLNDLFHIPLCLTKSAMTW